jgi:hypothetical protein
MLLKLENIIVFTIYWLFSGTTRMHPQCTMPVCLQVASAGGVESIILSVDGFESMMLSASAEGMDSLSVSLESIIISAPPAESVILSVLFGCVTATATKKNNQAN